MGMDDVPRCQHVKINGTQCGSPALRHRRRCFFHDRFRRARAKALANTTAKRSFDLPLLEDANTVQIALMKVIQMLGAGSLEPKTAGLMLYALQTATANLRNVRFEPEKPTDVVIDHKTVDQTCINGPQWFARDFVGQAEEAEKPLAAASVGQASAEHAAEEAHPEKASQEKVRASRVRASKRKRPERAGIEQAPEWVQQILNHRPPAMEARVEAG